MKNIFYSMCGIMVLFMVSCRKDDNPRIPALERVPVPYIKADPTKSQSISVLNPTAFSQTFTFTPYFINDVPPKQMDLVVIKNGVNGTVKTIQAGFTTFPATVNVTGAQLITMFGAIKLGDTFTFGLDITAADGTVYHAFPALGVGYGSGVLNEYNGATNVTPLAAGGGVVYQLAYGALCTYDPNLYVGNFKATDAWGDADGAIIVLTKIDNTHFSFIYPSAVNPNPIIVTVNPNNNTATIPANTVIGTAWSPAFGYPATATYANPTINSLVAGSVAPCDKTVTLSIQWGTAGGTLQFGGGPYTLLLTKQ